MLKYQVFTKPKNFIEISVGEAVMKAELFEITGISPLTKAFVSSDIQPITKENR